MFTAVWNFLRKASMKKCFQHANSGEWKLNGILLALSAGDFWDFHQVLHSLNNICCVHCWSWGSTGKINDCFLNNFSKDSQRDTTWSWRTTWILPLTNFWTCDFRILKYFSQTLFGMGVKQNTTHFCVSNNMRMKNSFFS